MSMLIRAVQSCRRSTVVALVTISMGAATGSGARGELSAQPVATPVTSPALAVEVAYPRPDAELAETVSAPAKQQPTSRVALASEEETARPTRLSQTYFGAGVLAGDAGDLAEEARSVPSTRVGQSPQHTATPVDAPASTATSVSSSSESDRPAEDLSESEPAQVTSASVESEAEENQVEAEDEVLVAAANDQGAWNSSSEKVTVQEFHFEGNSVCSDAELSKFVAKHIGKQLSLADLKRIASEIADHYHAQGYFLAKVVVPEQDVSKGAVTLRVLEGRLGKIQVTGNRRYRTGAILKHFVKLREQRVIRKDTLERCILLLNDDPGLSATAVLQAGDTPGTTDIIVKVTEEKPLSGELEFNNFGSPYASREQFAGNFTIANASGHGDPLDLRLASGTEPDELFYGRLKYTTGPLDAAGTRISLYYLQGTVDLGREFTALNVTGRARSFGVSASRALQRSRTRTLTFNTGFDVKNSSQNLLGFKSSRDRIRSIYLGLDYENIGDRKKDYASVYVHQGLGDSFGGMKNNDPFSSRFRADGRFTKLTLSAARIQQLNPRKYLIGRFSGQITSRSLVIGEQMAIGGADSVRGYPQSELLGDNGFQVSIEGRYVLNPDDPNKWQAAFFVDYGSIYVKNPVAGQSKSQHLTGVGIGLRGAPREDLSIRADIGYGISGRPSAGGKLQPYIQILKRF